jgi:drug/metabolite transporter (DMT)-like permease
MGLAPASSGASPFFRVTAPDAPPARPVSSLDALLLLLVLIWGINYSLLKRVFQVMDPMAFNVLRFGLASAVLITGIAAARRLDRAGRPVDRVFLTAERLTPRDRFDLVWLGVVGHCVYQWCFSGGLPRTSVSSSALIMATTPVIVSTASALLGHERLRRLHWLGIVVSLAGVVSVVSAGASHAGDSLAGNTLMSAAAICWAVFTLGGNRLMLRHSPLYVSGVTTAIGTVVYTIFAVPAVRSIAWPAVTPAIWGAVAFSGLLSIAASYLIWYAAIQRIGPARTSIYANMVPIAAMGIATVWLREPLSVRKIMGAAAVLTGVVLTRLARPAAAVVPSEE